MKSIRALWFNCKIAYDKIVENGLIKKITEQYVVEALSFTEAEAHIIEEVAKYSCGEFEVKDIKQASFKEVFFSEDAEADRWYRVKLDFIFTDEKSGKEKRSREIYLVQADSLRGALKSIEHIMSTTMGDYEAASIADTKILDVFQYINKAEKNPEEQA